MSDKRKEIDIGKDLKIERDLKSKRIETFIVPSNLSQKGLLAMLFMYLDDLNLTLDNFSRSNNKYSLVLSIFTGVLILFAIIQIVLFVYR